MVKRIKKKKVVVPDARTFELFAALDAAMDAEPDDHAIFRHFIALIEHRHVGRSTRDPALKAMLTTLGRTGIGEHVFTTTPAFTAYECADPPLIHGMARFGTSMVPFFYLPARQAGMAALVEGEALTPQRFSPA